MATRYLRVNPGDLIKATFVNSLLDALEKLEDRVTVLEQLTTSSGPPVFIDEVNPQGTLELGANVTLKGRNFSTPASSNKVSVDGIPITNFDAFSSSTQMGFNIPLTLSVTKETTAQIVVFNAEGGLPGARTIQVKPKAVVPSGGVIVKYFAHELESPSSSDLAPVVAKGQTWLFTFVVTISSNQPARMLFTPTVVLSGPAGGSAWTVKILKDDKSETDSIPLDIAATSPSGMQKTVAVRLRIPNDAVNAAIGTVTLTVKETTPGTQVTSGNDRAIATIGVKIPDPVSTISVTLANASLGAQIAADSVQFKKNQLGAVRFSISTKEVGSHTMKVEARDATGWTIDSGSANLPPVNGPTDFSPTVAFTAGPTAVSPNALLFTITHVQKQLSVQFVQTVTVVP